MTTELFQRARTDEQRAQRRAQILEVARKLLDGQRIADVSLNEIARQAGLAKSNVLRYFESREVILLTLLDEAYARWVDEVTQRLPQSSEPDPTERVAWVLADTAMARPMLCELLTSTTTVLEHNVTTADVTAFKLAVQASMARLMVAVAHELGPWDEARAGVFISGLHANLTAIWALAHPAPALVEAYASCQQIQGLPCAPEIALREALATLIVGLQHRAPRWV